MHPICTKFSHKHSEILRGSRCCGTMNPPKLQVQAAPLLGLGLRSRFYDRGSMECDDSVTGNVVLNSGVTRTLFLNMCISL